MQRTHLSRRFQSVPDFLILLLVATAIFGLVSLGKEWRTELNPVNTIDLSLRALPYYTILSGIRGMAAYFLSLLFTLVVGYVAAKSKAGERIIIPALDILQSIPVLGFLPGLVLGLIALFPHTNTGLEIAAILMIFTGQVWNMTFSYYSSLKSIPTDLEEAATVMNLSWYQRLVKLELPFSAVNLAWNSVLSMAGGWFFLSVCEAFRLGDQEYRLPGIGAYMAVAIERGDQRAMLMGAGAMVFLIVVMDFVIWRPILAWVRRFRLEEVLGVQEPEPFIQIILRESRIVRWLKVTFRRYQIHRIHQKMRASKGENPVISFLPIQAVGNSAAQYRRSLFLKLRIPQTVRLGELALSLATIALVVWGSWNLSEVLFRVSLLTWFSLLKNAVFTMSRVFIAVMLSTLWAVPAGIWIGTSERRIRIAQPIIQVMASFPAPMLYPIALGVFLHFGIRFEIGSMFLMMLGVQWYILFNVLAGAFRIPKELRYALALMDASRWDQWKTLYLPSVFPALVTGWVTAAGGAWNASIVAEIVSYQGQVIETGGLGATINHAAATQDFTLLAASLTVMVLVVLLLNRTLWNRLHHLAQSRFKMDIS